MFRLTAKITIESQKKWVFTKVNACEIERNADNLTTTCKITLPKKIKWKDEAELPIRKGDKIKVELGYDDNLELAFKGYIKKIGIKTPMVIDCEDEMYILKQVPAIKKTYLNPNLNDVLKEQLQGKVTYNIVGNIVVGGKLVVNEDNISDMLENLKKVANINAYFKDDVLQLGYIMETNVITGGKRQRFDTATNIIKYDNLKWEDAEDIKILIKATSQTLKGSKIELEAGDKGGEVRSLNTRNMTKEELKERAELELKKYKVDGLAGDFETFGAKLVQLGEVIRITIENELQGSYKVRKNIIKYGTSGYRQSITIKGRND